VKRGGKKGEGKRDLGAHGGEAGRSYGYADPLLVQPPRKSSRWRWIALLLALLLILGFWLALDQKLLFGKAWLSPTYDNPDWRTNEGSLHTFGAWDLEAHVWKTEYIIKYFPNFHWNPYWYLGMPLLKYYQSGFYVANWLAMLATGTSAPRAALLLIIFSHLLATLLTFLLCYKVSRRLWVSALCSLFILSNTFISLRSYGWEPITVTFLFLYPLGLLLFLKEPLRPFRFWLILVLAAAYLCHPLLWFSLCMTMGLYLFSIAIRRTDEPNAARRHYLWQYVALVLCSLLLGALQFVPQMSYQQVTSGAHMGIKYLPFYQVPPNIITLWDFFFDAGNLKGPGPIIMIAFLLILIFAAWDYWEKRHPSDKNTGEGERENGQGRGKEAVPAKRRSTILGHEMVAGLAFVLVVMVLFYYLELFNIFPMNFLRSIQYHRIIPEFIITAAALVAALANLPRTQQKRAVYYTMLIAFVAASAIVIYNVQVHWETTTTISNSQEFLYDNFSGRFTVPYTDQSLAVRNSFTQHPQVYGYYEQGVTNSYADEVFSVSSGYHNAYLTILYLKAANVGRLYVNTVEGERDRIITAKLNGTLPYVHQQGARYAYFEVPLTNPSFSQAVDTRRAAAVQLLEPGCRILFKERYCGSVGEEFVSTDPVAVQFIAAYVKLLEEPYGANATMAMVDPDHYQINVTNATASTAVVVKMTYDKDFVATVDGQDVPIQKFGPDFMLISPGRSGSYTIRLTYKVSKLILVGLAISVATLLLLLAFFLFRPRLRTAEDRLRQKLTGLPSTRPAREDAHATPPKMEREKRRTSIGVHA
jgi:hypothetical protein